VISVIIPTYNRASFLQRAIDSVFNQILPPDELLIIDDGSTDGTGSMLAAIFDRAPLPVRLIRQENRGASAARNTGIQQAAGDILCFLDSDDWWHPEKISFQLKKMQEKPDILISHTREIWYRHGVRVNQKKKHAPPDGYIFSRCLRMCVVGMSTVMARRIFFDRFGLFDPVLPCCEDYDLWLRAAREVPFLLVDRALTLKDGGRPDQLSQIYRRGMDKFRIQSMQKILKSNLLTREQRQETLFELKRKCTIYGRGCIKHGRRQEGENYLAIPGKYSEI